MSVSVSDVWQVQSLEPSTSQLRLERKGRGFQLQTSNFMLNFTSFCNVKLKKISVFEIRL